MQAPAPLEAAPAPGSRDGLGKAGLVVAGHHRLRLEDGGLTANFAHLRPGQFRKAKRGQFMHPGNHDPAAGRRRKEPGEIGACRALLGP